MTPKDKRAFMRINVNRPVELSIGGRIFLGTISNESKGGLFIEVKGSFSLEAAVKMAYIGSQAIKIERSGKIVRIDKSGIAVHFTNSGYAK